MVNECGAFPKDAPIVAPPVASWLPLSGRGGGGKDDVFPCPNDGTALDAVGYAADSLTLVTKSANPLGDPTISSTQRHTADDV